MAVLEVGRGRGHVEHASAGGDDRAVLGERRAGVVDGDARERLGVGDAA